MVRTSRGEELAVDQETNGRARILVAVGHPLFRDAVTSVLDSQRDLHVDASASDGPQAITAARTQGPELAIIDLGLPNCDPIAATAEIVNGVPGCRVLVLADGEDDEALLAAVEAGASGFLTSDAPMTEMIDTVRRTYRGETTIPGRMLGGLITSLVHRRRERDRAGRIARSLTRREREVLSLLADGADNDAIAQALVISPQTVRTHIQNMLSKLGVHSRLEAASFVIRNGLRDELEVTAS
jgi:DNA-binding NarL/FixJ family response regulator